jgi:lambda family phage portal protein
VRVSRPGVFARIRAALRPEPTPPRRARVNAAWGGMSQHTPRLLSSFYAPTLSANQEVEMSIRLLRARARALVQNNGYAAGFVDECVSNIVGPQGIQLCAQNRRLDGELHTPTNDAIESAWQQWAEAAEYVSADGRTAWVEMQGLIVRTIVVDGEAFYRERRGDSDNPFGYSIELIDPDLVDEHYTVRQAPNGNEIRMGVELDARGRAVAYHVWNRHPSEGGTIRVRVPATEMRHVFRPLRPGQVRGVPWFAPVLQTHAFLAMYEEAEVTAARWSAAKLGMWIPGPDADLDPNAPKQVPLDAPPGSIVEGPQGYTFDTFDPQHPNQAFKDFVGTLLRGIARGLGISYLTLTGDVSAANYSSMKAGLLPERDLWRALHGWLARSVHRVVYRNWLEMALLTRTLVLDSRLASTYQDVKWLPRGWRPIDPRGDTEAAQLLISLGLESRTRLAAEQGDDFEELIDELSQESDYAKAAGVDISGEQVRARPQADTPAASPKPEGAPDAMLTRLRAVP